MFLKIWHYKFRYRRSEKKEEIKTGLLSSSPPCMHMLFLWACDTSISVQPPALGTTVLLPSPFAIFPGLCSMFRPLFSWSSRTWGSSLHAAVSVSRTHFTHVMLKRGDWPWQHLLFSVLYIRAVLVLPINPAVMVVPQSIVDAIDSNQIYRRHWTGSIPRIK